MQFPRSTEIRNFGLTQFYQAGSNLMPGSNTAFMAEALIRVVDTYEQTIEAAEYQQIFGNVHENGGSNLVGWCIFAVPNSGANELVNGQRPIRFSVAVWDGAGAFSQATVTLALSNVLGTSLLLSLVWVPATSLQLFVNGALMALDSSSPVTVSPSSGNAAIGAPSYSAGGDFEALTVASVLGAAYGDNGIVTSSQHNIDRAMAQRFLETKKRGTVVNNIASNVAPNGLDYVYNADEPGGLGNTAPSSITNLGRAAPAGAFVKQGVGTTLICTAGYTDWASVARIDVAGPTGATGPTGPTGP